MAWPHTAMTELLDRAAPSVVAEGLAEADGWSVDDGARYCRRCGVTLDAPAAHRAFDEDGRALPCRRCEGTRPPWQRVTRLTAYEPPAREWLRAMKFRRRWAWASWFGRALADVLPGPEPVGHGRVWAVAVPMPWARRWWRGYNQTDLIARALAKRRGWPVTPLLKRTRYAPPQTAVAPSRRPENTRGAFACENIDLAGHRFVLVDDILTTGSTLKACARLLRQQGARHIEAAVVAVADPKDRTALEL